MIKVIRTAKKDCVSWREMPNMDFSKEYCKDKSSIVVKSDVLFQKHLGFGGAFTEAAAVTLSEEKDDVRNEVIRAYFDKEHGLGYNLGRVSIHSSDFSLGNYTYIEEGDKELSTFDLSHEDKWVVPLIKDCEAMSGERLNLLASPWSPPAFMKSNKDMNFGGKLLPEFRKSWAKYYVKFIQEMKKRGILISSISIQNEPEAVQVWDSCEVTAQEEADFIQNFLYPELKQTGLENINIIIWDHNRDNIVKRANITLSNKKVKDYVWGVGYHWYVCDKSENLSVLHALYPDKHILFTEGCVELTNTALNSKAVGNPGEWGHGGIYGRNIIRDFNNYCEGFIDWNLVLNEIGGPNHKQNYCEAPIMINRETGKIIYNASYYYIGHFSRYIKPGAHRLLCLNDIEKDIYATAYKNPNGEIVIVVQNDGWINELALIVDGKGINITLPNESITTYIINCN
ncbi:MAG: glycoside hydrolase family 30 beta sandwich domain-containing protein [Clostridiaceae bacterium]